MHPDPDHDVEPFNPFIIARAPLTPPRAPSLGDLARAMGLVLAAPLPGAPLRSYDDFANALAPHVETAPAVELDDAALKALLTQRTDTHRTPPAPRVDVHTYVGTSGQQGPMLRDEGGPRRFAAIDLDPTERDAMWADAAAAQNGGAR